MNHIAENWPVSGALPARSPLERLAAAIRGEIGPHTDWLEIVATANDHLVGPHLYRALDRGGHADGADPEAMSYLALLDSANVERNGLIAAQLCEITAAMNAAGVAPLVIKGAAILASQDDPASTARMMSDLDIVGDPESLAVMDGVLRELGYHVVEGTTRGHSAGSYWRDGATAAIDLHLTLPKRFAHLIPDRELEARTRTIDFCGTRIRVPDPGLHLAINLGHEMLHEQGIFSGVLELRYLLELVEFAERNRQRIDWDWLAGKRADWRFDLAVELQSRMARRLFRADPFPDSARSSLGAFLHRRRLVKARLDLLGRLEWAAVRRVIRLGERMGGSGA